MLVVDHDYARAEPWGIAIRRESDRLFDAGDQMAALMNLGSITEFPGGFAVASLRHYLVTSQ